MTGELIVSTFLGLSGLLLAYKSIQDYIKSKNERHRETLGAAANMKVLELMAEQQIEIDQGRVEMDKIKQKLATHDGIIEAIFKMRKD